MGYSSVYQRHQLVLILHILWSRELTVLGFWTYNLSSLPVSLLVDCLIPARHQIGCDQDESRTNVRSTHRPSGLATYDASWFLASRCSSLSRTPRGKKSRQEEGKPGDEQRQSLADQESSWKTLFLQDAEDTLYVLC